MMIVDNSLQKHHFRVQTNTGLHTGLPPVSKTFADLATSLDYRDGYGQLLFDSLPPGPWILWLRENIA